MVDSKEEDSWFVETHAGGASCNSHGDFLLSILFFCAAESQWCYDPVSSVPVTAHAACETQDGERGKCCSG